MKNFSAGYESSAFKNLMLAAVLALANVNGVRIVFGLALNLTAAANDRIGTENNFIRFIAVNGGKSL